VIEEHKKVQDDWRVNRTPLENISTLVKDVTYDISVCKKFSPSTIEVKQGRDVERVFYYALGNRVREVERIASVTDDAIVVTHTYTLTLTNGAVGVKRREVIEYLKSMSNAPDAPSVDLTCIKKDTKYLEIVEVVKIDINSIIDSVTVLEANTGVLLSINKTVVKPDNVNMGSNALIMLTNDIQLKDAPYYRVIGKDRVVSGVFSYKADNPAYALIYIVDGQTVEETDRAIIRSQYHIYTNKVDADNLASVYTDTIKSVDARRDELTTREKGLNLREKNMKKREDALTVKEADAIKKLAEAGKVNKETDILESAATIERARADNAEALSNADLDEKISSAMKHESNIAKSDSEKTLIDVKTVAAAIGVGVTGYALYSNYNSTDAIGKFMLKKLLF